MTSPELSPTHEQEGLKVAYNGIVRALDKNTRSLDIHTESFNNGCRVREFRSVTLPPEIARELLVGQSEIFDEIRVRTRRDPHDAKDPSWVATLLRNSARPFNELDPTGESHYTVWEERNYHSPAPEMRYILSICTPWSVTASRITAATQDEAGNTVYNVASTPFTGDPSERDYLTALAADMSTVTKNDAITFLHRVALAIS